MTRVTEYVTALDGNEDELFQLMLYRSLLGQKSQLSVAVRYGILKHKIPIANGLNLDNIYGWFCGEGSNEKARLVYNIP